MKWRNTARPKTQIARPRVFIPSFPGTNCELDSEKAFRRAGAETDVFVFRNLTPAGIEESVEALAKGIDRWRRLSCFQGGFSAGDDRMVPASLSQPLCAIRASWKRS